MKPGVLKRSGPIRRRARRDPVSPELRLAVLERDRDCVAAILDTFEGWSCRGRWTLDHVKDEPRMGVRAPSDAAHLVTLCEWHHLESGWATSHRPELRAYLEEVS
jgi:hypothetical protein